MSNNSCDRDNLRRQRNKERVKAGFYGIKAAFEGGALKNIPAYQRSMYKAGKALNKSRELNKKMKDCED